jgi:hypothetical protein
MTTNKPSDKDEVEIKCHMNKSQFINTKPFFALYDNLIKAVLPSLML